MLLCGPYLDVSGCGNPCLDHCSEVVDEVCNHKAKNYIHSHERNKEWSHQEMPTTSGVHFHWQNLWTKHINCESLCNRDSFLSLYMPILLEALYYPYP